MTPRPRSGSDEMASREGLRQVYAASVEMMRWLDLDHRVRAIVRAARAFEFADAASLMLRDDQADALVFSGQEGLSERYAARPGIPMDRARAAYKGDHHLVVDLREPPLGDPELARSEGLFAALALPLRLEGELIGALNLYTKDATRSFDPDDIEVAMLLAAHAAIAIANARLYREAVRQRELVAASEREREQFVSIVSHELRTPLTPLKALAQLLRSRIRRARSQGTPLDLDAFDGNLAAIERQVDRMNGLVSDLLSVSRAGRDTLQLERIDFDLAALARDVVQRYVDATAEEGRHRFEVEAPPGLRVRADQGRVEQLLMNLVGNAVKYSPTGGGVRVGLAANDASAELTIADQGIGIPPGEVLKLAQPFVRGAGRAATFAGMGIGLYVARIVAEAHGGSLALESEGDGKGTIIRVRLPL